MTRSIIFPSLVYTILFLATVALSVSCGQPQTDDERITKDTAAITELNRINGSLASSRPVTKLDIDTLVRLREQYPNSTVVRQLLQSSLIKRQDWTAALEVLESIPDDQRSLADKLNLAKIYLKQGQFQKAANLLKTVPAGVPEQTEARALLGQAEYYSGDLTTAANTLEQIRGDLIAQKRADDLAILGTIYSRQGEHAKAIDVLTRTVEVAPESISAYNALSRAHAAAGDTEKAETAQAKLESLNERATAEEKRKLSIVPLIYQLEKAYEAKNHDEVISLANRLQPDADPNTKLVLYQYLASAYRAKGNEAEARNAIAEAEKLSRK